MDENELIYERWVEEIWNERREEVIDEIFDEDGVAFYPYFVKSEEPIRGADQFKEFFHLVWKNFSDFSIKTLDLVAEGNKIIAHCIIRAVQKTTDSEGLAVREKAELKCLCKFRIENGKIVEYWNNVDLSEQNPKVPLLTL